MYSVYVVDDEPIILSGIIHLFIGLRDILWIRGMYGHDALFSEEAVESRDGTLIAALTEFNP